MKLLLDLFLTFAKIGCFTFGGGYAMISLIEDACVAKKHWITHEDMMTVTVIAESTPGPIAINCATYTGFRMAGFPGAVAATVGIVLPSFVLLYVISRFLDSFLEIPWIEHAFQGIRLAVGILILDAGITMVRKMPKNRLSLLLMIGAFFTVILCELFSRRISSVVIMLFGAAASLLLSRHTEGGPDR